MLTFQINSFKMILLSWHRLNYNCLFFCKDLVIVFLSCCLLELSLFSWLPLLLWEKPFNTVLFICFNYFSSRFIDCLRAVRFKSKKKKEEIIWKYNMGGVINWTEIVKESLIEGKVFNNSTQTYPISKK